MKGKIATILIILSLFILIDFIFFKLNVSFGNSAAISMLVFIINSILLFLLIETLIYKKLFDFKSGKFKIVFFTVVPFILSMHIADRFLIINQFYLYSKTLDKRTSGTVWKVDQYLAHKAIPDAHGSFIYYIGDGIKDSIPIIIDSIGYRTVADSLKLKNKTLDLYLGCSFTFGDGIEAQYSYPYLTSKFLGHNYINTGASAYGSGQMVQVADSLTGQYQFNYVFIQLSPWLSRRSMSMIRTTPYGYRPYPYFSDVGSGFKLNPPSFSTLMIYSRKNLRDTERSYFEKTLFLFSDGFKAEVIDYYSYVIATIKIKLGILPEPTKRKADLEKYVYNRIIDCCKKNNAIPIILKLCYPTDQCKPLLENLKTRAQVIDLDFDLERKVIETKVPYEKLFSVYHTEGKDSVIIDRHPNKVAHELFSLRIIKDIKNR